MRDFLLEASFLTEHRSLAQAPGADSLFCKQSGTLFRNQGKHLSLRRLAGLLSDPRILQSLQDMSRLWKGEA